MANDNPYGSRRDQLIVAISGMVGVDLAHTNLFNIDKRVRDHLTGPARRKALKYLDELSRVDDAEEKAKIEAKTSASEPEPAEEDDTIEI